MRIILASHNPGKTKEFKELFAGTNAEILNLDDIGISEDPVEDGTTFIENARKKVAFVLERGIEDWIIADDSGICIEVLGGAPGVYSARWAGKGASGKKIVARTLAELKNIPAEGRDAWFECVIALASPEGHHFSFSGSVRGTITEAPRGNAHPKLPYDSIFAPAGYRKTFAELSDKIKNRLSHRARATKLVKQFFLDREVLK